MHVRSAWEFDCSSIYRERLGVLVNIDHAVEEGSRLAARSIFGLSTREVAQSSRLRHRKSDNPHPGEAVASYPLPANYSNLLLKQLRFCSQLHTF